MTENIEMYLVGGAVRDNLLGIQSKDLDYTVVVDPALGFSIDDAYEFMVQHLLAKGFTIFLETPEFLTVRAKFPKDHKNAKQTADFVLARREGPYSDSRRPDWVEPGTLEDDLRRRDFTVNAMALADDGSLIDLFGGQKDLENKILRAVGDPQERLLEDPLRAFRAVRFSVTKNLRINAKLRDAMMTVRVLDKMEDVSVDRIREELHRSFAYDTVGTILTLCDDFPYLLGLMNRKGIWLMPTTKDAK